MPLICPKCKETLSFQTNSARCANGHCYDRAKEGYWNLLLGAGAGTHGDNAAMVTARRTFLSTDAYLPLAEKVASLAAALSPSGGALLDCGCGEGYYTAHIARALDDAGKTVSVNGFDISKDAVRRAAKAVKSGVFAVASAYDQPYADGSFDTAVNLFSPLAIDETRRVLKSGGHFLMAIPGEEHLWGLKAALYETPYKNSVGDTALDGFSLIDTVKLTYDLHLTDHATVAALFGMTPYAYRTGKAGIDKVESMQTLDTAVDFRVFVYRRR